MEQQLYLASAYRFNLKIKKIFRELIKSYLVRLDRLHTITIINTQPNLKMSRSRLFVGLPAVRDFSRSRMRYIRHLRPNKGAFHLYQQRNYCREYNRIAFPKFSSMLSIILKLCGRDTNYLNLYMICDCNELFPFHKYTVNVLFSEISRG